MASSVTADRPPLTLRTASVTQTPRGPRGVPAGASWTAVRSGLGQRTVRAEDQTQRDLALLDRALGQRATGVQGDELGELHPVGVLEARLAERPGRALLRTTEDER